MSESAQHLTFDNKKAFRLIILAGCIIFPAIITIIFVMRPNPGASRYLTLIPDNPVYIYRLLTSGEKVEDKHKLEEIYNFQFVKEIIIAESKEYRVEILIGKPSDATQFIKGKSLSRISVNGTDCYSHEEIFIAHIEGDVFVRCKADHLPTVIKRYKNRTLAKEDKLFNYVKVRSDGDARVSETKRIFGNKKIVAFSESFYSEKSFYKGSYYLGDLNKTKKFLSDLKNSSILEKTALELKIDKDKIINFTKSLKVKKVVIQVLLTSPSKTSSLTPTEISSLINYLILH